MNDQSTTDDPTEEFPPTPPPGDPTGPRRLRRSSYDRMIAGVSGGVAEYFGIDPIIVRLGFVALALLGGSGVGLYLIAWLVMPDAHQNESAAINALRGGHRPGGRAFLAIGLLLVGIVVLSSSVFWLPVGDGLFLPLLILAAGIALLVWPADGPRWHSRWHMDQEEWREERDAVRSEWRRERDAWRATRHQWRHGYRRGVRADAKHEPFGGQEGHNEGDGESSESDGESTLPPPQFPYFYKPPVPPRPPAPHRASRHRRRRPRPAPFLGPIGLALILLYTGLTVFADRVDWWQTDPASFLSVCLMIIGGVLVISAFLGRARGLIWLGLLLLPIAWAVAAVDLTWWDGVGEESVTVDDLAQLEDEYRFGIGQYKVDLSDLDLDGQTRTLEIGLTIGDLTVWVPETMGLEIDVDSRIGKIAVTDQSRQLIDEGFDNAIDRTTGDPAGGTLHLDVDLGIGDGEIIVCGSESVPCP